MESPAAIGSQNFGGAGSPSALIGAGLDEAGAHLALDAAERLGVTVIDTAFSYAAGRAQEMIGSWLAADPDRPGRMTIVDKLGVVEKDGEIQLDLSFDTLLSHAATGRKRLGVATVDVVLAHAPDPNTPAEETLNGFGSLISDGLAAGWGVSNINGSTLTEWLDAAQRLGLPSPLFVENEYSLLERGVEETVLPICREEGIGFLAYRPSVGGMLSGKYRRGEPPPEGSLLALRPDMQIEIDDKVEQVITAVTEIAAQREVSNVAVAFAWLLEQSGVAPIAGPSKPHHMEAVEQALELNLSNDELQRLASF